MSPQTEQTDLPTGDLSGLVLGEYQLLRRLGQGGMSYVYLAMQKSLQRKVALKILKSELAEDESYVRRFEREAQAAAKLTQANIVQIYEVGHVDGYHFIAQEYVAGRNLRQYISRHGAVEPVMAVNVLRQCSRALQKATELGVVHRDIKPENIMLSTKGEVKIADFGLARILDRAGDQALTQVGVTMGTPLYMSPEQVGGDALDHRSDIYSLGITAYHMLAGNPPFDGENALAVAMQHFNSDAASLRGIRPDVPDKLIDVIEKMMAKKPDERPQNAKELLKALRKVPIDQDEDWDMIVEKLSIAETTILHTDTSTWSQAQLAATRQLQQVMTGNDGRSWQLLWLLLGAALLGISGAFAGAYFADHSEYRSILDVDDIETQLIPRRKSVQEQYEAARWAPPMQQEKYLTAVIDYFPLDQAGEQSEQETRLHHRYAKARLAEFYLSQDRYADALPIFEEFTGYEDLEERLQVTGWAGIAIVLDALRAQQFSGTDFERQTDLNEAIRKVSGREDMLNEFMRERFDKILEQKNAVEIPPSVIERSIEG
ncbi:serine/threonine protein kinase [Mariniblastus sp.]|nr:serine/threonine protein kinase [Mariniblastus sp.]